VSHPRGHLLFDTGVHCRAAADPIGRMGERRARLFRVLSGPSDHVVAQLALLGLRPDDIAWVVNSHLHFDHCGGNEFFPRSTFLVQRRELDAARSETPVPGYSPSALDFDHPLQYRDVDGDHDVFGDGSVVLMPTYGHTPGHQSLHLRPPGGGEWIFTADACYTRGNMDRDTLPGVVWDAAEMTRSLHALRDLRDRRGVALVYGHDPAQWQDLARAPRALA
jgi:glyoxylase-like metal-dependent hydrolase (beta-lactamase superfamily II)